MADEFIITKEIVANADTYIPITMKELIAADVARACVKETNLIKPIGDGEDQTMNMYGLAPVWCESPSSKARVMMTLLLGTYLHVWPEDTPLLCDYKDYDNWAGSHVLNQLERFKAGEYREKAFDILADYREMERYLNSAIYSVLREMNDPTKRFLEALGSMASEETMRGAIDDIQLLKNGIDKERERQERIIHGDGTEEGDTGGE